MLQASKLRRISYAYDLARFNRMDSSRDASPSSDELVGQGPESRKLRRRQLRYEVHRGWLKSC